jgi:hypothetical protein
MEAGYASTSDESDFQFFHSGSPLQTNPVLLFLNGGASVPHIPVEVRTEFSALIAARIDGRVDERTPLDFACRIESGQELFEQGAAGEAPQPGHEIGHGVVSPKLGILPGALKASR